MIASQVLVVGMLAAMGLGAVAADGAAPIRREEFVVASAIDGQPLRGEVDWPAVPPRAIIVMYPGSGTHTRDVLFSARGAPRSFVFRDLSDQLLRAGFATVRYDERGTVCRAGATPDAVGRCFDDEDARRINWATLHSDALAICRRAERAAGGRFISARCHRARRNHHYLQASQPINGSQPMSERRAGWQAVWL